MPFDPAIYALDLAEERLNAWDALLGQFEATERAAEDILTPKQLARLRVLRLEAAQARDELRRRLRGPDELDVRLGALAVVLGARRDAA